MTADIAIVIGLVILVLALVSGIAMRKRFPRGQGLLAALLVVIAAAAALLLALLVA